MEKETSGSRLHIGIFGSVNAGKSTVFNLLTGQNYSIVSDLRGTTTDSVSKAMEIRGVGPVVFIDTAGFDDVSELGKKREEKTWEAFSKCDIAIVILCSNADEKSDWYKKITDSKKALVKLSRKELVITGDLSSEQNKTIRETIIEKIRNAVPADFGVTDFTEGLCRAKQNVMLVMPQDIQAPKGRLILPQVQIIRELLDKGCYIHCCNKENFVEALEQLNAPPELIITDSQLFNFVYEHKSEQSKLTSFSILMASNKGNIKEFVAATEQIKKLNNNSRVLIAEACTHSPTTEDIGREKIPAMLRKLAPEIKIDFARGVDFPIADYDLIIHCGACMFNRAFMLDRQNQAIQNNIPMTNYGIFIAAMNGILDKIVLPE